MGRCDARAQPAPGSGALEQQDDGRHQLEEAVEPGHAKVPAVGLEQVPTGPGGQAQGEHGKDDEGSPTEVVLEVARAGTEAHHRVTLTRFVGDHLHPQRVVDRLHEAEQQDQAHAEHGVQPRREPPKLPVRAVARRRPLEASADELQTGRAQQEGRREPEQGHGEPVEPASPRSPQPPERDGAEVVEMAEHDVVSSQQVPI